MQCKRCSCRREKEADRLLLCNLHEHIRSTTRLDCVRYSDVECLRGQLLLTYFTALRAALVVS